MRPLSYLTGERLDELLSSALRAAKRIGGRYNKFNSWEGPVVPSLVFTLIEEWVARNRGGA